MFKKIEAQAKKWFSKRKKVHLLNNASVKNKL